MTCNFRIGIYSSVECNNDISQLASLSADDVHIILSEIGLLFGPVTENYRICTQHQHEIIERNRLNRLRVKSCGVPSLICFHQGTKRGERPLTKDGMLNIHRNTGLILPIGTQICSKCRKHLLSSSSSSELHLPSGKDFSHPSSTDIIDENAEEVTDYHLGDQEENCADKNCDENTTEDICTSEVDSCDIFSQTSVASEFFIGKREQLNSFLALSNLSPLKERRVTLRASGEKTANKSIAKAMQCFSAICETICPGEGELLKDMVFETISNNHSEKNFVLDSTSSLLKDIYNSAETWTLQRQILSIIAKDRNFSQTKQLLPDMTLWKFYKAKHHSDDVGCGVPVPQGKVKRDKVDISQLEHFIDYIVSSNIVKDLPFGMRTMRLSSGEIVEIPNLIRSLAPSSLISQYTDYCESENIRHLGSSTLFKILNDCAASVRKCIEGLDYYVAEGGRAFQDLNSIIDRIDISEEERKKIKSHLIDAKRYIKSDYKVHIQKESTVADHCRLYALSAVEKYYAGTCSHQHTDQCSNCSLLENTLLEIQEILHKSIVENKDAVLFEAESAIDNIKEWKCHILRSRNQEDARLELVRDLEEGELLVTCDWAMKFLPRKYREGQTDWFAKRGINWHIAVTVYKAGGMIENFTHVHIFSSQVAQDASVTASLMVDLVAELNKLLPNNKGIHLFSDNAGCYKNTLLLTSLYQKLGNKVKSYNFSEAQDGKGPCDRRSSHIKSCIKRYVNEGHDVTSAEQMKVAIDARQNGRYRIKVVDVINVLENAKPQLKPISGITQLNNFSYESEGLRVWKAYGIGEGKLIKWDSLGSCPDGNELMTKMDWTSIQIATEEEMDRNGPSAKRQKVSIQFDCPKDGCVKSFVSQLHLDDHLLLGNCSYEQKLSLHDKAKVLYGNKVNSMFISTEEVQIPCSLQAGQSNLESGWALKVKKKRTVFTEEQKQFMVDMFNIGKRTGRKVDPYDAAIEMRAGKKYPFTKDQYLTGQQISSYFSRLSLKDRKTDMEDFKAANDEESKSNLKLQILENTE